MTINEILTIPILEVLDKLWVDYKQESEHEYALYRGGKKSDGRKANTEKNIVADFSHGTGAGNTFSFAEKELRMNDSETFKRFEEYFGNWFTPVQHTQIEPVNLVPIMNVRFELPEANKDQIFYLETRGISYEKVKHLVRDYGGAIACLIHKAGEPIGLNARKLSWEKSQRFLSKKWYGAPGLYMTSDLDSDNENLIVVEGMMDFLTVAQYTNNVVGLKNCDSWLDDLIDLWSRFNIILCNDCDEAGYKTLEKMPIAKYKHFDICKEIEWWWIDNVKDINDFYLQFKLWDQLPAYIYEHSVWEDSKEYKDFTIEEMETRAQLWELAFEYPHKMFRDEFDCLTSWEFVLLASKTNSWKSSYARKLLEANQKDYKCCYINLEFPINQQLELAFKRTLWLNENDIKRKGTNIMPYSDEEKERLSKYIKKSRESIKYFDLAQWTSIQELINMIYKLNRDWYNMLVIDSFSSIQDAKDSLATQTKLISTLHEICKKTWLLIIWVHHFNKTGEAVAGSQKIEDLANVVISITKEESDSGWTFSRVHLKKDKSFWFVKAVDCIYTAEWEYDYL